MRLPCFWIDTNVASDDWYFEIVTDRCIPIIISCKYLKENEIKLHIRKRISSFVKHIHVLVPKTNLCFCRDYCCSDEHYLLCVVFIVIFKKHSIVAIGKAKAFHPLIGILSSLNSNPRYFCPIPKIYLKVLEDVISFRNPCSISPGSQQEM